MQVDSSATALASSPSVQCEELLNAVEAIRVSPTSTTQVVNGWSINWSVRPGNSAAVRGDLCIVDPQDGQRIYSLVALKRKLGLVDTAVAAAGASAEDQDASARPPEIDQARRTGRVVKSTTVMVDGQAVKRANMYTMDSGESSVWDQELGGADTAEAPGALRAPQPATKKARVSVPRPPPVLSALQLRRQQRNDELRDAKAASAVRRKAFLAPHANVLARFGATVLADDGGPAFDEVMESCKTIDPPMQLSAQMRDYQLDGLRWLSAMHQCGVNAILADEMGLGKTLQTIALLSHVKFTLEEPGPHLVIAPLSVLSAWTAEFRRFCPEMRILKLHSSDSEERARLMATVEDCDAYDVAITTPEMAKAPNVQTKLAHRSW